MGRSKGGKSASAPTLEAGTRVFAKVRGYPFWPARIEEAVKGDKYRVFFYGTYETANVKKADVVLFDEASKAKHGNQMKRKGFPQAMHEIEENPGLLTKEQIDENPELVDPELLEGNADSSQEEIGEGDLQMVEDGEDEGEAMDTAEPEVAEEVADAQPKQTETETVSSSKEVVEKIEKPPEDSKATVEAEGDAKVVDDTSSVHVADKSAEEAKEVLEADNKPTVAATSLKESEVPSDVPQEPQEQETPEMKTQTGKEKSLAQEEKVAVDSTDDVKMKELQENEKMEKTEEKIEHVDQTKSDEGTADVTSTVSVAKSSGGPSAETEVTTTKRGRAPSARKRSQVEKQDGAGEEESTPRSKKLAGTPAAVTSRSGRVIKPKKFNDDETEQHNRRQSVDNEKRSSGRVQRGSVSTSGPVAAAAKKPRKMWVQVKATGETIEINMDDSRPAMFENEEEELRWERATARNALKFKEKVESGQFIPEEIKLRIEAKQKRSPEEEAILEKEKNNAKRAQKLSVLKTELRLAELDKQLKQSLPSEEPNMLLCLELLSELEGLNVTNLMLKKQPQVVATMRNLRKYVGPSCDDKDEATKTTMTNNVQKICLKAEQIVSRWISNFALGEGQIFWDVFDSEVVKFRDATEKLEPETLVTLTTDPANNTPAAVTAE